MVTVLGQQNSIANNFLAELRNIDIQRDSQRFRKNLERLGEVFAYEISKKLPYQQKDIDSPLGIAPLRGLALDWTRRNGSYSLTGQGDRYIDFLIKAVTK